MIQFGSPKLIQKFTLYSVCVAGEQFAYEKPVGESRGNCLFFARFLSAWNLFGHFTLLSKDQLACLFLVLGKI